MAIAAIRVPTTFTAVDRFSHVVRTMERNLGSFGNASQGAASRIGSKMVAVGTQMMATSAIVVASLSVPLKKAIEFEDQMASINTILELDTGGIKKLGDEILAMASKTSTPIHELTRAYQELVSAGVEQKDAMGFLGSADKLSIVGLGTLPQSTDIMLATMRNFKKDFSSTQEAANVLIKTIKYGKTTLEQLSEAYSKNAVSANILGIKGREFNSAIAGMSIISVPISELQNMIGNLSIALDKGSGKLPEIFTELGAKNAKELLKQTGGFLPMLDAIAKKGKELGFNQSQIFPLKGAKTGFTILTENEDVRKTYDKSLKDMEDNANDMLSRTFTIKQATGKFGMGVLTNNLNAMAITVGNDLVPALLELTKELNPLLKSFSLFIKENPGVVSGFAKLAVGFGLLGIAITAGGWMFKLYSFGAIWIPEIVAGLEMLGITFSGTAAAIGVSSGFLLGWFALFTGAFVLLGVLINDIIVNFDDWGQIILVFLGPLGWLSILIMDVADNWTYLTEAFEKKGFMGALEALGNILENSILKSLEKILNIASRLPLLGNLFGAIRNEFVTPNINPSLGGSAMQNLSAFPANNGGVPAMWQQQKKTENVAGKSTRDRDMAEMIAVLKKGQIVTLNMNDPFGFVKDANSSSGIKVKVDSTLGIPKNK